MKTFINFIKENVQQIQEPFFLSGDVLWISDDIVKELIPTYQDWYDCFDNFDNEEERVRRSKSNTQNFGDKRITLHCNKEYNHVAYDDGRFRMNLHFQKITTTRENKFGTFNYYLSGNSGDSDMHGKNMVRATRECNMEFMIKIFPIVKNFKYKQIQSFCDKNSGEGFTKMIKDYIELMEKKGKLSNCKGRLPDSLGDDFDWLTGGDDFGLL